ncbi:MAG: hypothetical protein GX119_01385 [Syntrophomonadaceae bacterium]|nr:hypothetical protein [Syntrophomonadaceae bacterium]
MILKYTDEYARKFTFAEEAVKVVKSGDRVIYAFGICSINELDRALAMRKNELIRVEIICNDITCGYYAMDADFSEEHFKFYEGMNLRKREREKVHEGGTKGRSYPKLDHSPKQDSSAPIFLATVSPMDKDGYFWFDSNLSQKNHFRPYYERAEYVILEINERILEGNKKNQECIHISQTDMIVGSNNDELLQRVNVPGKNPLYDEQSIITRSWAV